MKLVSDYEEYYRQYIAKNPLRRAAEWERLYSEEIYKGTPMRKPSNSLLG